MTLFRLTANSNAISELRKDVLHEATKVLVETCKGNRQIMKQLLKTKI